MPQPDFANLQAVLERRAPARPTLFEFFLNERLHERLAGGPPAGPDLLSRCRWLLKAFLAAGYDYVTVPGSSFHFPKGERHRAASLSQNEGALIVDRASFERYPWPEPEQFDYGLLTALAADLPDGMKLVVSGPGGVLENVTDLVGFETMCLMVHDDPDLAQDIFDAVGSRLVRHYTIAAAHDTVGALIGNDDWGHKTQTMLPPALMRQYVFGWHQRLVAAMHAAGKPAILHSCGNRRDVLGDIIEGLGYDAIHSYEDLIQPVEEAYEQHAGRIATLGGIDVDFLCRADRAAIQARCEAMLARSAERGGYALGSGNSIPYYVPDEAWQAMVEVATAGRG